MATGDFWKRALGVELPIDKKDLFFGASLVRLCLIELVVGGGASVNRVRQMMQLASGADDTSEFADLVTSISSINNANAMIKKSLQSYVINYLFDAICVGGRSTKIPNNLFSTGEDLRQRIKTEITNMGGTNSGSMAV